MSYRHGLRPLCKIVARPRSSVSLSTAANRGQATTGKPLSAAAMPNVKEKMSSNHFEPTINIKTEVPGLRLFF